MIQAEGLTKRYGSKLAVDNISFTIPAGQVTGFLGPNGAGKSTTMRMIMGLDSPTAGTVTVNGKPFAQHKNPAQQVGALLDAKGIHPGRSARSHLRALAASNNIPMRRVDEVLTITGLTEVAKKRAGGFSLGMGQRLGIAAALLGDPQVLIFDEPVNGLDPEGVRWVREMCRSLAAEGRTVFVSSHLMSEMAQTADHLLVIGKGRILTQGPVDAVIAAVTSTSVQVRSPRLGELGQLLANSGATVSNTGDGSLQITGVDAAAVGELAAQHGLALHELTTLKASLEDAYLTLTADQVEYRTVKMGENR